MDVRIEFQIDGRVEKTIFNIHDEQIAEVLYEALCLHPSVVSIEATATKEEKWQPSSQ